MVNEMEERIDLLGLKKALDFGYHEHSLWGNFKIIWTAFGISLVWTMIATVALGYLTALKPNEIQALIQAHLEIYNQLPATILASPKMMFFLACVLAPLWEEAAFRFSPLKLAKSWEFASTGEEYGSLLTSRCLWPMMVFTSIIFGLQHGGAINILFQGAGGILLAWVYVKSGYWASVTTHALWNFMMMYGLPAVVGALATP